jgi:DNA-binding CsgD family transcriptional regulator
MTPASNPGDGARDRRPGGRGAEAGGRIDPQPATFSDQTTQRLDRLTPMERACLQLVARRRSSKEIAAELGIAKTSVDTYCNRARAKLEVPDRYEAARLVVAHGEPSPALRAPDTPTAGPGELMNRGSISWLSIAIGALMGVLALASLVSGMAALEQMKDPHSLVREPASSPTQHLR